MVNAHLNKAATPPTVEEPGVIFFSPAKQKQSCTEVSSKTLEILLHVFFFLANLV